MSTFDPATPESEATPPSTPDPRGYTWSQDPQTGAWRPSSDWSHAETHQQHPAGRIDVPLEQMRRNRGGLTGGIAAIGLVLLKYGALLLKTKFLLGILVNVVIYAVLFGLRFGPVWGVGFAVGFVGLIFIHEMGHVIAAEIEHVPVTPPLFIPFMGAAIFLKQNPRDARSEAVIAIGGPITGTLGSMAVYGLGRSLGDSSELGLFLVVLAGYGFFINLFNLIPARPLDGGRILGAVSRWFNLAGFAVLLGGILLGFLPQYSIVLWIIVAITGYSTYQRFTRPQPAGYWSVKPLARAAIGLGYLALLGTLVFAYAATEAYLQTARV